jgi:nucleotide-binding universal stress UspA family protein
MRIVCPIDASAGAAAAVDKVIATFEPSDVSIDVLVVLEGRTEHIEEAASGLLESARERLREAGFETTANSRPGHPGAEIVAFAESVLPDLVVLGARPRSEHGAGFSGRVASTVASHCPCSVMIARDAGTVASIVLGYDSSPDAEAALALLTRLPFKARPSVAVCTAYAIEEPFASGIAPTVMDDFWASRHQDLLDARRVAEAMSLDAVGRLRGAGFEATPHARHGRASEQLTILAGESAADLIAVGSRGLSGIRQFLLGSTSHELVALTPTSLLVARQ